jgi:signal transduction histidine kinase
VAALERAHRLAKAGLQDARRAIGALRDDEELPGPELLAALAREFERDSGIRVDLAVTGRPQLGPEARLALYRTAQEALTNVRKHAHARSVEPRLAGRPQGARLTVEDRAVSGHWPPPPSGEGYGLTGMRERAELLGGTLTAGPTATGFRVELWLPPIDPEGFGEPRGVPRSTRRGSGNPEGAPRSIRVLVADDRRVVREGPVLLLGPTS